MPLPEKGKKLGAGKEKGETLEGGREGVGVSVTLSARWRDRQNPTGSQSTHFRPDPPRQNHPEEPEPALTSEPAQLCTLAASGAQLQKSAPPADARFFPSLPTARLERAPRPFRKLHRSESERNPASVQGE